MSNLLPKKPTAATRGAALLPCPFCGGTDLEEDATAVIGSRLGKEYQSGWIECKTCRANGPQAEVANVTMQPARTLWNTRAPDAAREALAELVACKDLQERYEAISPIKPGCEKEVLRDEYRKRKPLAWEAARRALKGGK